MSAMSDIDVTLQTDWQNLGAELDLPFTWYLHRSDLWEITETSEGLTLWHPYGFSWLPVLEGWDLATLVYYVDKQAPPVPVLIEDPGRDWFWLRRLGIRQ